MPYYKVGPDVAVGPESLVGRFYVRRAGEFKVAIELEAGLVVAVSRVAVRVALCGARRRIHVLLVLGVGGRGSEGGQRRDGPGESGQHPWPER